MKERNGFNQVEAPICIKKGISMWSFGTKSISPEVVYLDNDGIFHGPEHIRKEIEKAILEGRSLGYV